MFFLKTIRNIKSRNLILKFLLFIYIQGHSQVLITTGSYTQDFGNTDITSWTNNSTFLGWYLSSTTSFYHQNVTTSPVPSNNGGIYSYECNSDNNQKLGTRPSNSYPGSVGTYYHYGVRLKNNSGKTIYSLKISFDAHQLSLAGNANIQNTLDFSYQVSASSITNLTTGSYINVPSLQYIAPRDTSSNYSSNQLFGFPCTISENKTTCLSVLIPNNYEIMLRWSDVNDSNNDHHLAIDNVTIDFGIDYSDCSLLLPITLVDFKCISEEKGYNLYWATASEHNSKDFEIQYSTDGIIFNTIQKVAARGESNSFTSYSQFIHNKFSSPLVYFRLKINDINGIYTYSPIVYIQNDFFANISITPNPVSIGENVSVFMDEKMEYNNTEIALYNIAGERIRQVRVEFIHTSIDTKDLPAGLYQLNVTNAYQTKNFRLIIQ